MPVSSAPAWRRPVRTTSRARRADGQGRLVIRPATTRDVGTIVRLIRGLAAYERLSHEVRVSAARVRRDGFGRTRYFDTLLCERDGVPIGFALYFFTYSTFVAQPTLYLEDLFVLPPERGEGAGRELLRALARIALARGCGRMEWTVLDWNASAIRFYESLGARLRRDWILTRLTGEPLGALARRRVRRRASPRCSSVPRARSSVRPIVGSNGIV